MRGSRRAHDGYVCVESVQSLLDTTKSDFILLSLRKHRRAENHSINFTYFRECTHPSVVTKSFEKLTADRCCARDALGIREMSSASTRCPFSSNHFTKSDSRFTSSADACAPTIYEKYKLSMPFELFCKVKSPVVRVVVQTASARCCTNR